MGIAIVIGSRLSGIGDTNIMTIAVVYEDSKPIRVFNTPACIYDAYKWCHHHFCLSDYEPSLPLHKLPKWLEVKLYVVTPEQFAEIVK